MKTTIITLLALSSFSTFASTGNINVVVGKNKANILFDGAAAQKVSSTMTLAKRSKNGSERTSALRTSIAGKQISCVTISTIVYRTTCFLTFDSEGTASVTKAEINNTSADGKVEVGGLGDYSNITITGEAAKALSKLLNNSQGQDINCTATKCQFSVDASGSINRNFAK